MKTVELSLNSVFYGIFEHRTPLFITLISISANKSSKEHTLGNSSLGHPQGLDSRLDQSEDSSALRFNFN